MLILKTCAYCVFCEIAREQRGEYYHFELCSKLLNFCCCNHLIHIDHWKDGISFGLGGLYSKDLLTLDNIFIMGFCNCVGVSFIPLF